MSIIINIWLDVLDYIVKIMIGFAFLIAMWNYSLEVMVVMVMAFFFRKIYLQIIKHLY